MAEQPGLIEQPHVTALVRNSEFLHTHLEDKVKSLLPVLVDASFLTVKKKNRIERARDKSEALEILLAYVKLYDVKKFVRFLEVLRDLVSKDGDKDAMCCLERLVNEVRKASNLSLSPVSKERFDELKTFVSSLESQSTLASTPTCTALDTDELMQSPVAGSPSLPPYFPNVETTFISESNMRFYSPVHGVDVSFKSLPPGVKKFKLQVSVLDPSLFKQSDDLELCTMVVEIKTIPRSLQFEEEAILVSIPHCAVISCSYDAECLSVRTLPDIADVLDFSKGEEIKADFGNGYCAQFNISHFTLFAGVREKRKRPRFMNTVLNTKEQHNTTSPAKRFMSAGMLPVTSLQPVGQSRNSFPVFDMFSKVNIITFILMILYISYFDGLSKT